jgi:hypothetical protein
MDDREKTVLAGGAEQFWAVYMRKQRYVRVAHRNGSVFRYAGGGCNPDWKWHHNGARDLLRRAGFVTTVERYMLL